VESNEPTTPSGTAASGTFAPEAASTHEQSPCRLRDITENHTLVEMNHAIDPYTRATINSVPPVNEYMPERDSPPGAPTMTVRNSISMLAPSGALGSGVAERSSIALTPSPHNPDAGRSVLPVGASAAFSPLPLLPFRQLDPVAQAAEPRDEESTPSRVRMAVHPCHRATDVALRLAVPATPRATSTPGSALRSPGVTVSMSKPSTSSLSGRASTISPSRSMPQSGSPGR